MEWEVVIMLDDSQTVHLMVQLVPAVTELLISELLWLNYSGPEKPVYMYVNSIGSQTADGQVRAQETSGHVCPCVTGPHPA